FITGDNEYHQNLIETDQNTSLEENNSKDPTNKNQIQVSLKEEYEEFHEFPDPKYMFDLKTKGHTTPENYLDCQITVDSFKKWTYREVEEPSCYNIH
ncbi:12447_t:CDS:2, partial [Dentiscutata erythropus]